MMNTNGKIPLVDLLTLHREAGERIGIGLSWPERWWKTPVRRSIALE
jgi:hypothetical protein